MSSYSPDLVVPIIWLFTPHYNLNTSHYCSDGAYNLKYSMLFYQKSSFCIKKIQGHLFAICSNEHILKDIINISFCGKNVMKKIKLCKKEK